MPPARPTSCVQAASRSRSRCARSTASPTVSSIPTATASTYSSRRADGYGDRGLLATCPPGQGSIRLRALPAHGRAPLAAAHTGGAGAPRRAPLPDGAPVLGALAEARLLRGRGCDGAPPQERDGGGDSPPTPFGRGDEDRDAATGPARAHVAVGVPVDPARPRPRQRVRLARLPLG